MISLSGNEDGSILIVDLKPTKTHLDFNKDVISSIKETNFSILIPNIDFYYPETFRVSRIKYINKFLNKVHKLYIKKEKPIYGVILNIVYAISVNRIEWNKLIVLTHHNLLFFFFYLFLNKKTNKIFLFSHNNFDDYMARSKFRKTLIKFYSMSVITIFFEKYIYQEAIRQHYAPKSFLFFLPLPIEKYDCNNNVIEFDCSIIGTTSNQIFIDEIIDYERTTSILSKNKLNLAIRTKLRELVPKSILIIDNSYLSKEEYVDILCKSNSIGVFLWESHKFRSSSVLRHALYNNKSVFMLESRLSNSYLDKYPNLINIIKTPKEFFEKIINLRNKHETHDFESFQRLNNFSLFSRIFNSILIKS